MIRLLYRAPVITSHRSEMNYSITCGKKAIHVAPRSCNVKLFFFFFFRCIVMILEKKIADFRSLRFLCLK